MRIFNENKTIELPISTNIDYEEYTLVEDYLTIHHDAIEPVEEVSHYEVVKEYPNGGKDVVKVIDVEAVEGHDAYDEKEMILVVKKLTIEQKKNLLRHKRFGILNAFDIFKSNVSFGIENISEKRKIEIINWYYDILDLQKDAYENIPSEIKKYMN